MLPREKFFSLLTTLLDEVATDDSLEFKEIKEKYVNVIEMMSLYFKDKEMSIGGPIPINDLFSIKNIKLVANSQGCGIELCYFILNEQTPVNKRPIHKREDNEDESDASDDWDIRIVLGIINDIIFAKIANIYREGVYGIVLLHLKYCMGYQLDNKIYNLILK